VPLAEKVKNAGKMPALRLNGRALGERRVSRVHRNLYEDS
jgi:hypothetical protein